MCYAHVFPWLWCSAVLHSTAHVYPHSLICCRGQLTSCVVTTETLCRGHTHQLAVCASASGETGEQSQREYDGVSCICITCTVLLIGSEVEVPSLAPDQPLPPKIASRYTLYTHVFGVEWVNIQEFAIRYLAGLWEVRSQTLLPSS